MRDGGSLADAQATKLDRLCELLELSPRDHLLEIGCGWGGMAIHAARTRGCRVTAITLSREQHELAAARVAAAGLADRVLQRLVLLARQRDRGDSAAARPRGVDRHPAPATTDLEQVIARRQLE